MSWSVGADGKAPEVKASIEKQFATSGPCVEPEETIRLGAAKLITVALEAQDQAKDVRVSAYGSMSSNGTTIRNSLNITIAPEN